MTTLCYIEKEKKYLMLHRVSKKNDINKDKWIGVGGHFEEGESPEECLLREVREETGLILTDWRFRGIVTFCSEDYPTEYMCLYTAEGFQGELADCDEGTLEWVDKSRMNELQLWDGDILFLDLLRREVPFFSLKLCYRKDGFWYKAVLNGKELELFDICREDGTPTGRVKERSMVHRDGDLHRTVHMWIVRRRDDGGVDVLLQKRSANKDSYPGCYDISSAGHMHAGDDFQESAVREIEEELGLHVEFSDFRFVGFHHGNLTDTFWGEQFVDREVSAVYLYDKPIKIEELKLQESEVEEVRFFDYFEIQRGMQDKTLPNCIYQEEFLMLGRALGLI